jgi:hypothetical protein
MNTYKKSTCNSFRKNTCKTKDLNPFIFNTYKNGGGGGVMVNLRSAAMKDLSIYKLAVEESVSELTPTFQRSTLEQAP